MGYNTLVAGAVAHWKLQDDAASTAVVDELGSYNGTLVGGDNTEDITTTGPNTWLPAALQFDGSADYVTTLAPGQGLTDNTIACWVKTDNTGVQQTIMDSGSGPSARFGTKIGTTGLFVGGKYDSSLSQYGYEPATTQWTHVGFNGSELVINGTVVSKTPAGTCVLGTGAYVRIGARSSASVADYFDGAIAGAIYFDTALSSGDIAELYAGPEPVNTVAPVASQAGNTLTCTTGTWDDRDNGTPTYGYQWYDADTSLPITGKAGTFYRPAADGNYKCLVRASNNGSFDANEDTFSNTVAFTRVEIEYDPVERKSRRPLNKMSVGLR